MTNDLKNFLEEEKYKINQDLQEPHLYDLSKGADLKRWIADHDTRLINHVLDLVGKEVKSKSFEIKTPETISELQKVISLDSVSTIINNLRIK